MSNLCWYCYGDPPEEGGPCEACDERAALNVTIDRLTAENERLRVALMPFADLQEQILADAVRDCRIWLGTDLVPVLWSDLIAVKKATAPFEETTT